MWASASIVSYTCLCWLNKQKLLPVLLPVLLSLEHNIGDQERGHTTWSSRKLRIQNSNGLRLVAFFEIRTHCIPMVGTGKEGRTIIGSWGDLNRKLPFRELKMSTTHTHTCATPAITTSAVFTYMHTCAWFLSPTEFLMHEVANQRLRTLPFSLSLRSPLFER